MEGRPAGTCYYCIPSALEWDEFQYFPSNLLNFAHINLAPTHRSRMSNLCCAVAARSVEGPRDAGVGRVVLVQEREQLGGAGRGAPRAHELRHDGEHGDDLDAALAHAIVGHVADELARRARRLAVGKHLVASVGHGQCGEGGAYGRSVGVSGGQSVWRRVDGPQGRKGRGARDATSVVRRTDVSGDA